MKHKSIKRAIVYPQWNQSKLAFSILLALASSVNAATLPSVSVSGVTATSPVVRATALANGGSDINVTATVLPTYDSGSGPTTTGGNCQGKTKVSTTTTVTVSDQTLNVSASDPFNAVSLTGPTPFSGTLPTPLSGSDGKKTVTINATVSDTVTTTTTTTTSTYPSAPCAGTPVITSATAVTPVTNNGSGTGSTTYTLDVISPVLTFQPDASQPIILQGENKNIHNVMIAGSANTPYTLTDTVTGPGGYTSSADGNGSFNSEAPAGSGIAPNEHDLVGVHIACDAPVGTYTAAAVAYTKDLGNNSFDPIGSSDVVGPPQGSAQDTFQVDPGILLADQTEVVSELPPSGDYAPMSCFTSTPSGHKINTFPGSLHITATVNTTGPCSGFGTISGTQVHLTLPAGFSFADSGASPKAHVFIGPAAGGLDFHNPSTLAEVTSLIPKPTVSGQTVTVNLSSLNLGQGAGVIPATDTIYVRAHGVFSDGSVPADGTLYVFTTSTDSNLAGIGPTTNSSSRTITASQACVGGN